MMNVETISERLLALGDVVQSALEAVDADDAASEQLRRTVRDLAEQHREVQNRSARAEKADPRIARERVHLLEAVAERARHEALEANGVAEGTCQTVCDAHDAIARLAGEVEAPAWKV